MIKIRIDGSNKLFKVSKALQGTQRPLSPQRQKLKQRSFMLGNLVVYIIFVIER